MKLVWLPVSLLCSLAFVLGVPAWGQWEPPAEEETPPAIGEEEPVMPSEADLDQRVGRYRTGVVGRAKLSKQVDQDEAAIDRDILGSLLEFREFRSVGPSFPLFRPVAGRIKDVFGMRFHPILRYYRPHRGVDFAGVAGTPIRAAADGRVISATSKGSFGNCLIIDHGGKIYTLYAHCTKLVAAKDAAVIRGQIVATVGTTGLSTGPHLHFEVRRNGVAVDPAKYL